MGQIVTVTLNPAIDETVMLDGLKLGAVNRATGAVFWPGGKGVNVSSCLADYGIVSVATGFLGDGNAAIFERLFVEKGIGDGFVRVAGDTRVNLKLAHGGETTDVNLPGVAVDFAAVRGLVARLEAMAREDVVFLLAGRLPPGVEAGVFAEMVGVLAKLGAKVFVDTSGAPLKAVLEGAVAPFCVKPNRAELEEVFGRAFTDMREVAGAAVALRGTGLGMVVVSLGAEGALFVGESVIHAMVPALRVESSVGAGDAMVAGILAAVAAGGDLERVARLGTAFAAGKLGKAGANLPGRDAIEALAARVEIVKF